MPQFDFFTFVTQGFWFINTFFVFYFIVLRTYIVKYSEVLKMREKIILEKEQKRAKVNLYDHFISAILLPKGEEELNLLEKSNQKGIKE